MVYALRIEGATSSSQEKEVYLYSRMMVQKQFPHASSPSPSLSPSRTGDGFHRCWTDHATNFNSFMVYSSQEHSLLNRARILAAGTGFGSKGKTIIQLSK